MVSEERRVVSYLEIDRRQQIEIAITFFEINKDFDRNLGVQGSAKFGEFQFFNRIAQGVTPTAVSQSFDFDDFKLFLNYLEERSEGRTLAEPTLIVTSGEPASFLAGGETPIVTSIATGAQAQQNIRFEPFGVKLSVLPTLLTENYVHLHVIPEIRNIDPNLTDFVSSGTDETSGIRPPAFRTRRTETQVEMEIGQTLILSGLLNDETLQNLSKTPGIGSIPILGDLFKSKSFQKNESELFITLTPRLITSNRDIKDSKRVAELGVRAKNFEKRAHIPRRLAHDESLLLLEPPDTKKEKFPSEAEVEEYLINTSPSSIKPVSSPAALPDAVELEFDEDLDFMNFEADSVGFDIFEVVESDPITEKPIVVSPAYVDLSPRIQEEAPSGSILHQLRSINARRNRLKGSR